MQSTATDVSAYIAEAPEDRHVFLTTLRDLCQETLIGYTESMEYGMASYSRNGIVEVAFASQKNYISLYILKKEVVDSLREELSGLSVGKGCIRYSKPAKMDFTIIRKLLTGTVHSPDTPC